MTTRTLALIVSLLALVACERSDDSKPRPAAAAEPAPAAAQAHAESAPTFVNKVWAVAESKRVAVGDLRTFLSNGTLVMASSHGAPAFGAWRHDGSRLTIVEDGMEYPTDILELNERAFRIRMHGSSRSTGIARWRRGTASSSNWPATVISARSDRSPAGSSRSARAPKCALPTITAGTAP